MDIVRPEQVVHKYKDLPQADLAGLAAKTSVDPLPLVVGPDEALWLQRAAAQWGRLLTRVYRDLWGKQTLVTQGVLTPELVWGTLGLDPAFCGVLPQEVPPLGLVRLDAVRTAQGWALVGLGTEVPWGLGEVLETRLAHGRTWGAQVPHDNVVRLAPFFQGLKDQWFASSLTHKDEPSIMVWTSGPSDPRYFEPVFLSRYFGYPLVESRDLTVRSGRVYLKTLGGLRPVDVLVRMVGDRAFDPLAGNPGGAGGVAGLTQAVRDGSVLVTNAPGAGLLSHRGLLDRYAAVQASWGETLALAPLGHGFGAGTEEFFEHQSWRAAPVGIRLFVRFDGDWDLLPGGLVQRLEGSTFDPQGFEGTKKDLWFLSTEVVAPVTLIPTGERPTDVGRADLPSRVADDLFWLGRYTERAWVDLRFLERWWEVRSEGGAGGRGSGAAFLDTLVRTLAIVPEEAPADEGVWKTSRLADTLRSIHQIGGQLLDRMSLETHRILREFEGLLASDAPVPEVLRQINLRLAAFSGLTMESMTRSPGWRFLDMGRRLERAWLVLEALGEGLKLDAEAEVGLSLLLDVFDSTLTYRTRYRLAPQKGPVLDLLVLDETNPRSLAFQLESLSRHVELLPRPPGRPYRSVEERTILDLSTRVRMADGAALAQGDLGAFLGGLGEGLDTFSQALYQTYLAKIDTMAALQARSRGAS